MIARDRLDRFSGAGSDDGGGEDWQLGA